MSGRALFGILGTTVAVMIGAAPVAGQRPLGELPSLTDQTLREPLPPLETFGPGFQATWIGAANFSGTDVAGLNLVIDVGSFYGNLGGSAMLNGFYAEVKLPDGAKVVGIQCPVYDASATSDVLFIYYKSRYNIVTKAVGTAFSVNFSSAGSSGYQEPALMVPPAGQLIKREEGNEWYLYHLFAGLNNETRFLGCRLIWQRTVSPSPAMATFNDVPLGHPQRQFIEALAAAGITGGCGGGNYCPDALLTRGQMAVFLASALGLFWPF